MVFTTPAIAALRRRFPGAHLTYLVESGAEPVVRHHPDLDDVLIAGRPRGFARLAYDWQLARRLRRSRYDIVIDFHGGTRSAWLTVASGAPTRVGYDVPGRGWCYTTRVPWSRSLVPPRHSVQNLWDLIATLGIDEPNRIQDPVVMPLDAAAVLAVTTRLNAAHVPADARIVVMHVSAGNPFRRWPAEAFAAVAAALASEDPTRRILITSGPSEAAAAQAVAAAARTRAGSAADGIVRCGEFDLSELRALIARAALYIGGDSGPLHLAATTSTPVVALFGPTLPGRSMPWRDPAIPAVAVDAGDLPCRPCHQRHCVPGDFRCLTRITPDQVIAAAHRALRQN